MSVSTSAPAHADAAQHARIRRLLQQHRSARLDQVQGYTYADPTISDLDPGVQLRSLQAARRALQEIDEAIARLDAGTYGRCTGCTQRIPSERLDVLPHVTVCVRCASPA
jgi:DnaK suppressor protein